MNNIPNSFIGYKKNVVDEILNQKDSLLGTQQQDIDYLRSEVDKLKKEVKKQETKTFRYIKKNK